MASTTIPVRSSKPLEVINITPLINDFLKKVSFGEGAVLVFTKHTTTGLMINENEPGLIADLEDSLKRVVPDSGYRHDKLDSNAAAHLRSVVLGPSLVLPVSDSRLDLGTWQTVFLVELDGPRNRTVTLRTINGP